MVERKLTAEEIEAKKREIVKLNYKIAACKADIKRRVFLTATRNVLENEVKKGFGLVDNRPESER